MPKANRVVTDRTIPEHNCPDGQETHSADALIPDNPTDISIQLTSSEWAAKAGQGTVTWGVQRSPTGPTGVFADWIIVADLPIGAVDRSGQLDRVTLAGGTLLGFVGHSVRLFARPVGVSIQLGAQVSIGS